MTKYLIAIIIVIQLLLINYDTGGELVQPGVAKVASDGFRRQLRYHGVLSSHFDWELKTWVFWRDNQRVKLKTRSK